MLDVLLQHADRVLLLVSARQLAVCDCSDLEGRHVIKNDIKIVCLS